MGSVLQTCENPAEQRYVGIVPEIYQPLPDPPEASQVIIIGSGFGGAIAAFRLASAGYQVTVLERGSRWPTGTGRETFAKDWAPDGRGFWFQDRSVINNEPVDRFGGVLDVSTYPNLQVWRGAAVGGGSVVFTGVLAQPERRHFDQVFGDTPLTFDEMNNQWYPLARTNLGAAPMPDDIYNSAPFAHSRTWDNEARRAGYNPELVDGIWDWDIVRAEIAGNAVPSTTLGLSNLGVSNGAKRDLSTSYLGWAELTGNAAVYPGHQVNSIGVGADGRYTVAIDKRTPEGQTLASRTLRCDRLFLAAGTVGTNELLVAAQANGTLPNLNGEIGQGIGSNGDAAAARVFSNTGGPTQASPCRSRIIDDFGGLPATLQNWYAATVEQDLGIITSLGMTIDPTRGNFRFDGGSVTLDFPAGRQPQTAQAVRAMNNRIAAANGTTGGAPLVGLADVVTDYTAHPLGGAILGKACDAYGRVNGHAGLYVIDGSLIPGSTALVNPSLTVSALAERNVANIIATGF
jgi:cholesterol oxidase